MGSASKAKAARKAEALANPHAKLSTAIEVIGWVYGSYADCAAVSAFLKVTAAKLGYELTPRSVSLIANQPSKKNHAHMGPKATALIPESEQHRVEDYKPDGRDTGHMVLVSEDLMLMIDPNIGQLRGYGMAAPNSLAVAIESTEPASGEWLASAPDLRLVYMPDDNPALWPHYEASLIDAEENAAKLAMFINRGFSAARIKTMLKQHPGH